ncbi:HlyD family type I secretion membrane fusion protein [Rhodoligotrophos appendicifer]|uniref:HlyD family type I secretion periplasmic adaptor subunit n=1 Tax=Rhodoligotrophos appendicifer TaxID=987056 RepID=UPI001478BA0F|nr:HlyD family type I secretion periplasmic adaptor subunit [Rhodoligotrophos appendicifer]
MASAPNSPASDVSEDGRKELAANLRSLGKISALGIAIVGIFVFGAGAWAAIAPLASAALAPGIVSPEGYRRTVQHLEGGIIAKILVSDGDKVRSGQPLIILDNTRDTANLDVVQMQRYATSAAAIRLDAEIMGRPLVFPQWLEEAAKRQTKVEEIVTSQKRLFQLRRETLDGQKKVLEQRIAQLNEQIVGRKAEVESTGRQLALLSQELDTAQGLVSKGLERRTRLLELQRGKAQFEGALSSAKASLASAEQQIGEANFQIIGVEAEFRDKASSQLAEVEKELASLDSRLSATADVVSRTKIVAPVGGTVVNLKFHTIGGVIPPGAPILDIVPDFEKLIIDVRIAPIDIDVVRVGQEALVHFTAFKQRSMPRIKGRVIYVAPDATSDPNTGASFYSGKVEVSQHEMGKIQPAIELLPGMPADAAITTGARTVMRYIMDPLIAAFQRSFVED